MAETSPFYQLQSRCVYWLAGSAGSEHHIWNSSVGATAWKPLTLAVPGAYTQTKHLFSPPDLCQGPSQAPCKPHITPTNPEFQLVLSNASSSSAPSGAALPLSFQNLLTAHPSNCDVLASTNLSIIHQLVHAAAPAPCPPLQPNFARSLASDIAP